MTSLYIHIPFCIRKCHYCDFNSGPHPSALMDRYIQTLGKEWEARAITSPFRTVYIGGGTPTALNEGQLERLFALVGDVIGSNRPEEYTIEANPGTLSPGKVRLIKMGGVSRISLGVQSFSERGLMLLGRIHGPAEAEEGFYMLRDAGFSNISLDLIFGWPGQTLEEWGQDLQRVVGLGPEHVSAYCLTVERGTPLSRDVRTGRLSRPDEDLQHKMFRKAISLFARAGYRHYEVSNFALKGGRATPDKECLHNINYWHNGPYLGLGAGAFSYVNSRRSSNVKDVQKYIEKINLGKGATTFAETLSPRRRAAETLVMALRMRSGITEGEFYRRTGYSLTELYGQSIKKFNRLGLLSLAGGRLHLTQKGLFLANQVMVEFV
ncbi:MAG: radical SAM family heme chaperone HemW [Candidatus Brocadiales bacterium]